MKTHTPTLTLIAIATSATLFWSCDRQSEPSPEVSEQEISEQAGETVEETVEATQETAAEAAEETQEAARQAAEQTREAIEETGDRIESATD